MTSVAASTDRPSSLGLNPGAKPPSSPRENKAEGSSWCVLRGGPAGCLFILVVFACSHSANFLTWFVALFSHTCLCKQA